MAALPKLVPDISPTAEVIYARYQKLGSAELPRPYLGGSIIGKSCERALYFDFRWATHKVFDGRMHRLFQTGHREEERVINDLIAAGLKVWSRNPATSKQWSWTDASVGHHLAGNADGIVQGVPDAPVAPHILEVKTHNTKSFTELKKLGVRESKPQHFAQMQKYMGWTIADFGKTNGCQRALYVAVCKDTDEIHAERVEYDETFDQHLITKAQRIVFASSLPTRISEDSSWYECKLCDHSDTCHGSRVPKVSCRTCAHATPEREGNARWTCAAHQRDITTDEQRAGCQQHVFLPFLLQNWAEAVDSDAGAIQYRVKATDRLLWNGGAGHHQIESKEIAAAQDKRALTDGGVQEFREVFGARIAA